MNKDFLSIGANRRCCRCGKKGIDRDKIHGLELEGDGGIGTGRITEIEDVICRDCRYELEEWLYGEEYSLREEVDLTFNICSNKE